MSVPHCPIYAGRRVSELGFLLCWVQDLAFAL